MGRPDVYAPIKRFAAGLVYRYCRLVLSGIGNFVFNAIVSPGHYVEYYVAASADRNIAWYCEHAGVVFNGLIHSLPVVTDIDR